MFKSVKKKIFLVGVLVCLLVSPLIRNTSVLAAEEWFEPDIREYESTLQQSAETGEVSDIPWANRILHSLGWSLLRLLIGSFPTEGGSAQNFQPGGALGGLVKIIAVLYQPPISSTEYFADLGKNLGIVKPAYAQGFGFEALKSLLPLWKAFRNLAYLLFTIVFLVTGFAVMFRARISPQAVVTIQSSLPKIVLALILVTFSYAIAGFLIDLIYFLFYLFINALLAFGGVTPEEARLFTENYTTGSLMQTLGQLGKQGYRGLKALLGRVTPLSLRILLPFFW